MDHLKIRKDLDRLDNSLLKIIKKRSKLVDLVESKLNKGENKKWEDLITLIPDIEYLYPVDMLYLNEELRKRGVIFSTKISGKTEYVFKL